jgi:RNA polymerase sigma-70 factor (ECF subfamily)
VLRLLRSHGASSPSEPSSSEPTDPLRALASSAASGDGGAQRSLLVSLGPTALRVVRSVLGVGHSDVDDVLQESMAAVYLALPSFRGDCSVLHFACRIVVQTAMNARRRAGYRSRLTPIFAPDDLAELVQNETSPVDSLGAARRREALRQLLCDLPAVQAEVLALHTMLGYSVEETAASTGAGVNTVRSRLRNALAALRAKLQADDALFELMKEDP